MRFSLRTMLPPPSTGSQPPLERQALHYRGIKDYYPRIPLSLKLRALLVNSRPLTLLLPLLGGYFVIQASLPAFSVPTPNPVKTWIALLCLVFVNAAGNNWNSVYDKHIDAVNKPFRPLPKGVLTSNQVFMFSVFLFGLALSLMWMINLTFAALVALSVLLTLEYSTPPLRLKQFLWVNNSVQALIRGVLGVLAAWCVYGALTFQVLGVGLVLFAFIIFAQTSKDIPDLEGDKQFNIRTLPVVYGVEKTIRIMTWGAPAPFIVIVFLVASRVLPLPALLLLLLLPVALIIPRKFKTLSQAENSVGWLLFYGVTISFLIGFAFIV